MFYSRGGSTDDAAPHVTSVWPHGLWLEDAFSVAADAILADPREQWDDGRGIICGATAEVGSALRGCIPVVDRDGPRYSNDTKASSLEPGGQLTFGACLFVGIS